MTSPRTLIEQMGLSLNVRRLQFIARFDTTISLKAFRRLYREHGISKKLVRPRLGPKRLPGLAIQRSQQEQLLRQLREAEAEGRERLVADECSFSPNSYTRSKHW